MEAGQFQFVGICKVLHTPLEFRKTPANIIQFPIVVHLDAYLLPSEPPLQLSDPRSDFFDLGCNSIQVSFPC